MKKKNTKKKTTSYRKPFLISLFVLLFSVAIWPVASSGISASSDHEHLPVVLVHGYNNRPGSCQGVGVSSYWGSATTELIDHSSFSENEIIPVSYYGCDVQGVDITGYGPGVTYPVVKTTGTTHPRAGYTNDASITRISQDLAWFIYNNFTQKGQPVNAVGHSMGGLIVREALRHVQAADPAFPPSLDIPTVLTMSTPHNGWKQKCTANTECIEMTPGSAFLSNLQTNKAPQGLYGTKWWAMGSQGALGDCDIINSKSATAVDGVPLIYTNPCYNHNRYLTDNIQTLNAKGSPAIQGRHSLAMMRYILE